MSRPGRSADSRFRGPGLAVLVVVMVIGVGSSRAAGPVNAGPARVPAQSVHAFFYRVASEGMLPTLRIGDRVLVDRYAYRQAAPRIGDIVLFHPPRGALAERCGKPPPPGQACAAATPGDSTASFVKRIVAGPGDRISIRSGHVIRDGRRAVEDFITPCGRGVRCDFPRPFTVPAGHYYLLGDNRGMSDDSSVFGPVPTRAIIGRVRRQRVVPSRVDVRAGPPAVGSGRGDGARWVLVGRRLRVTVARPIDPLARTPVEVGLTCGDDAAAGLRGDNPNTDPVWADVAYAQVRVPGKARQITARFNRDVARRANLCELDTNPGSFSFENTSLSSVMTLRQGTPLGCRAGRLERTLLRQGAVLVTVARLSLDIGNALAYRACLGRRQPLRPIAQGGAGGGASGESRVSELFTATGPWLAWTEVADSNDHGPYPPVLHALNLRSGQARVTYGDGNGGESSAAAETLGRVVRLTIGPTGTIAWVVDPTQEAQATTRAIPAELNIRPVSGPVVSIDRASTAGAIAALRISSDGQTLSWTHDGVGRTAPLPG